MTRTVSDPKLIGRVLKLYALAAGTSFAEEAASATAAAERLIAKHNIKLPSVKDRGAFASVVHTPHFKGMEWEVTLAHCAVALCGCALFFPGGKLENFRLVGTVGDLEACQYLLAILNRQRMRAWMRAKAEDVPDNFHSFCFSFARGVEANVNKRIGNDDLERAKRAELWWEEQIGYSTEPLDLNIHGGGRSEAGREAGKGASLHRGDVTGSAAPKLLTRSRCDTKGAEQ
jgi:hypothetical protein